MSRQVYMTCSLRHFSQQPTESHKCPSAGWTKDGWQTQWDTVAVKRILSSVTTRMSGGHCAEWSKLSYRQKLHVLSHMLNLKVWFIEAESRVDASTVERSGCSGAVVWRIWNFHPVEKSSRDYISWVTVVNVNTLHVLRDWDYSLTIFTTKLDKCLRKWVC